MAAKFSALAANYYNLPPVDSEATIRLKREKRGLCGGCGSKTYLLRRNFVGYKEYIPLTMDGIVRNGRCLYCYPDAKKNGEQDDSMLVIDGEIVNEDKDSIAVEILPLRYKSCIEADKNDQITNEIEYNPEPSAPPLFLMNEMQSDIRLNVNNASSTEQIRSNEQVPSNYKENDNRIKLERNDKPNLSSRMQDISQNLKRFPYCAHMQYEACKDLIAIILENAKMKTKILKYDIYSSLLIGMELCLDKVIVQQLACALIMISTHKNISNKKEIVILNGIEKIDKAMNHHSTNIDLICTACGALWSLSFDNVDAKKTIGDNTKIISLIISTMKSNSDTIKLFEWTLGFLHCLVSERSNQFYILQCDGLNVIDAAATTFESNQIIFKYATQLKYILTEGLLNDQSQI